MTIHHELICRMEDIGEVFKNLHEANTRPLKAERMEDGRYKVTWETEEEEGQENEMCKMPIIQQLEQ